MQFSPKQREVLTFWQKKNAPTALICDGAVRSGKTMCMALSFILWSFYAFCNGEFALCGKTIGSLRRNLLRPLLSQLTALGFGVKEVASQNRVELTLGKRRNCYTIFGGKDSGSASLIQGMTLCGVLFDEVALLHPEFVQQALARCSVVGSRFFFNCNPSSPYHWFYREWITKAKERDALYLHFTMEDNPSLTPDMIARYHRLYSGVFYRRYVLGEWVQGEDLVYPFLEQQDFCPVPTENMEAYVISCDYGTHNPTSMGLWGKLGHCYYRIGESYYDGKEQPRTDEEHYLALCQLAGDLPITTVIVDPSAKSFCTTILRHGKFTVKPACNKVLDGIRQVSVALKEGQIRICNTCQNAIREFSLYRWQPQQDAPCKENDHAMDDIRYFVATHLAKAKETAFSLAVGRSK